jgi:hypothetical protein
LVKAGDIAWKTDAGATFRRWIITELGSRRSDGAAHMRHAFGCIFIFLAAQLQEAARQIDLKIPNWNKSSIPAGPIPYLF